VHLSRPVFPRKLEGTLVAVAVLFGDKEMKPPILPLGFPLEAELMRP
jgi:hypothetical protein